MTSSVKPNLWSELTDLGLPEAGDGDARAALLRVNAEMFASAAVHDRESIETFEALVLGFLPRVGRATVRDIARILAPCADTPVSILDALSRRSPEARDIVLRHALHLPYPLNKRLLATSDGRLQLAARSTLDDATIERLLVLGEEAVEDALASNLSFASTHAAFARLVRRAQSRRNLARILLARADMTATDEAALYLAADDERRRSIRGRMAASQRSASRGPTPILKKQATLDLLAACEQGAVACLEDRLTAALGFPPSTDWRILEIGRHHLLPLALKALGVSMRDAARMLLTLHPALSYPLSTLKGLLREMRDVDSAVALALVKAIVNVKRPAR